MAVTLGILACVFLLLAFSHLPSDFILIGAVLALLLCGVLTVPQALDGLAKPDLIAVAILYIVGAGMQDTGAMGMLAERMLGKPKTPEGAVVRLMLPVAAISAFMNNTPLVAMMIPVVVDWSKQYRIPVSKLMMPLSFAAILGGVCSKIGTSTNLVVGSMVHDYAVSLKPGDAHFGAFENNSLGFLDITWSGVPCAVVGILFLALTSRWLLPNRKPVINMDADSRQYSVEMQVEAGSPLVGKTIEEAGLRHLPGVFLSELSRDEMVLPAVSPLERLRAGDRLAFVGIVDSVVDLRKIRGLVPATDQTTKIDVPVRDRSMVECVVSNTSPLVGRTIRDGKFRTRYNAVVLAVARNGERINKKIGDIELEAGDTLLIEGHASFVDEQRHNRDFFLVSRLENSNPPEHKRAWIAMTIMGLLVVAMTVEQFKAELGDRLGLSGPLPMPAFVTLTLLAATAMLAFRCTSITQARRSIDWETILAIAASFAIGKALDTSGAAQYLGEWMKELSVGSPILTLAIVYFVTLIVTELITNNAAAALMFPLAMKTAVAAGLNPMPFVVVIMIAASCGFATPIGYQTNLMVYGPGGYKFSDYLRVGIPLDILVGIVAVLVTPLAWPLK
ncbi:MAG: SLC13 family permease [Pirellulales bacterium]